MHYTTWYTAFCGWVAMKYPELVDLIQEELEEPDEPDADIADEDPARAAYASYWNKQKRLYGTIVSAVPNALRAALAANARYNGLEALELSGVTTLLSRLNLSIFVDVSCVASLVISLSLTRVCLSDALDHRQLDTTERLPLTLLSNESPNHCMH